MTPYPETEIMTLKRIEVALRKLDFKLLKDGSYKLHEKFHSGFRFEYLDFLKELYIKVSKDTNVPIDIKNILIPTIEDILRAQGQVGNAPQGVQYEPKPFQEFENITPPPNNSMSQPSQYNQYNNQQMQALNMQQQNYQQTQERPKPSDFKNNEDLVFKAQNQPTQAMQEPPYQPQQQQPQPIIQTNANAKISVFYGNQTLKEQEDRICAYKKLISQNATIDELTNLTSLIIEEEFIDIADLSLILNILKQKPNEVNLLTNSKSEKIPQILEENFDWGLFDFSNTKHKMNFYPLLGLIGLFKCKKCKREHFEIWNETMPTTLLCPNCKNTMFVDFAYSSDLDTSLNMEYYNSSICALVNSKIWLIVNPPLNNKIIADLMKSALKISKDVREIYIVSNKTEVSDKYKSIFYSVGKDVRIDASTSALNNFWQTLG